MRQNGIRPARFRFKVGGRVGKMGGGKMISGKQRKDEASGFYSPDPANKEKMKHLVFIHLTWE